MKRLITHYPVNHRPSPSFSPYDLEQQPKIVAILEHNSKSLIYSKPFAYVNNKVQ